MIGYTAAKKFKMNEIMGLMLGLAIVCPTLVGLAPNSLAASSPAWQEKCLGSILGMKYYATLFGIPVIMPSAGNYTSTVIPIILIVWVASKIEKFFKPRVPVSLKLFGEPLLTFLISLCLGLFIVGPVAAFITDLISKFFQVIFGVAPAIGGLLVGGFWMVLVMFGMHWALVPLMIINLANSGFDQVVAPMFGHSFALMTACIAVALKTKDQNIKSATLPAAISALVGITEPAIYGIALPKKLPFIFACVSSAVSGAILSITKSYTYMSGGLGIFQFPSYIMTQGFADAHNGGVISMSGLVWAVIAAVIAMVLGFVLTFVFYKEPEANTTAAAAPAMASGSASSASTGLELASPLTGKVIALKDVKDEAFSSETMGKGCAIVPSAGKVVAPCDGTISTMPDSKHAVGITTADGSDILIHVGMNTVELNGKHYTTKVKEGDAVKKGDTLIEFDLDAIKAAGYDTTTPVIICNADDFANIDLLAAAGSDVTAGAALVSASNV